MLYSITVRCYAPILTRHSGKKFPDAELNSASITAFLCPQSYERPGCRVVVLDRAHFRYQKTSAGSARWLRCRGPSARSLQRSDGEENSKRHRSVNELYAACCLPIGEQLGSPLRICRVAGIIAPPKVAPSRERSRLNPPHPYAPSKRML